MPDKLFLKKVDSTTIFKSNSTIRAIPNSEFEKHVFKEDSKSPLNYRLYKPRLDINLKKKYPLILVLHGSGSIGNDNESQLGLLSKLWLTSENKTKFKAFILAPQFSIRSSNYFRDSNRKVLISKPEPILNTCFELIDSLKSSMPIDSKRIYVIGYSMGGSTTINAISLRQDLFAAAISIAGIPQFDSSISISKIPIMLIHGTDDGENSIQSDSLFYSEMESKKHVNFIEIEHATHSTIFNFVDMNRIVPTWLFQFKK